MPRIIEKPVLIQAAGHPPKRIEEFIGRVCSGTDTVSIARMKSPAGWVEPGQTPEFDEYTVVLKGTLLRFVFLLSLRKVSLKDRQLDIHAGQAIVVERKGNGWSIAARMMMERSILRFVFLLSLRIWFIEIRSKKLDP